MLVLASQNAVEPRDIGVATSTATFMRQMGGTFGAAIFGSVLAGQLAVNLRKAFPNGAPEGVDANAVTGSPAVIAALPESVRTDVIDAFVGAIHLMFVVAVPITAVAFVQVLFLRELRLKERGDSTDDTPTSPGKAAVEGTGLADLADADGSVPEHAADSQPVSTRSDAE